MAKEISFVSVKSNLVDDLKKQFYKELKDVESIKTDTLLNILTKEKTIKTKFFVCDTQNITTHYIVFIVGVVDSTLIKLGKESCAFPRGFPIVWQPNKYIHMCGFLPKFSNDTREEKYTEDEFDGYTDTITFFKKWSGFLGQLIVYKIDNNKYWTGCSKNSVNNDSIFVFECRDLFREYITEELVDKLLKDNLHICAEMMSYKDQVHGARVLKATPIITAICQGTIIIDKEIKGNNDKDKYVVAYENEKVVELCNKYNLPVDSNIKISGKILVKDFLTKLCDERDFLTDSKLELLIKNKNYIISKGTVSHKEILGDILEGLVLHLSGQSGKKTIKFKFPNYTSRTMFLRELLTKYPDDLSNNNVIPVLNNWCKHWCISDNGILHWRKIGLIACDAIKNNKIKRNPDVGLHIEAMDYAILHSDQIIKEDIIDYSGTVIIIVAPIGFGKSTLGEFIANLGKGQTPKKDKYVHIDGDILGLSMEDVLNLGQERPTYTKWLIYKALIEGKTPIISTGGGVLGNNFTLSNDIKKIFNVSIKTIGILPENLEEAYNDTEATKNVAEYRNEVNYWSVDVKKIVEASKKNVKFAKIIRTSVDTCLYYKRNDSESLDIKKLNENVILTTKNIFEYGKFQQNRLLVNIPNIPKYKHITINYSANNEVLFNKLNLQYKRHTQKGYFVNDIINKISFVVLKNMLNLEGAHITIDSGVYAPKTIKDISLAMMNNKNKIELITKKNEKVSIKLGKLDNYEIITVNIIDNYYI
jgi:shikimate kinase